VADYALVRRAQFPGAQFHEEGDEHGDRVFFIIQLSQPGIAASPS
jgi:hypothetical protein